MGTVGYFEIRVDDVARAQQFYQSVFGWTFVRSEGFPIEYYMVNSSGSAGPGIQQGGMRTRDRPLPADQDVSGYICFVLVDAIDDVIASIEQHGGTMTSPTVSIPAGSFAYARDPEGNAFGVLQPARS